MFFYYTWRNIWEENIDFIYKFEQNYIVKNIKTFWENPCQSFWKIQENYEIIFESLWNVNGSFNFGDI